MKDEGRLLADPDTGQPGDQDALNIIRDKIANLSPRDRGQYRAVMAACENAGASIQLRLLPTEFRFNVARGLLSLFNTGDFHTDLVTAITRHVTGNRLHEVGKAIGSMTLQQSRSFAWIAMMLADGHLTLVYHPETNQFSIKEEIHV